MAVVHVLVETLDPDVNVDLLLPKNLSPNTPAGHETSSGKPESSVSQQNVAL